MIRMSGRALSPHRNGIQFENGIGRERCRETAFTALFVWLKLTPGRELPGIPEEYDVPVKEVRPLASARSTGRSPVSSMERMDVSSLRRPAFRNLLPGQLAAQRRKGKRDDLYRADDAESTRRERMRSLVERGRAQKGFGLHRRGRALSRSDAGVSTRFPIPGIVYSKAILPSPSSRGCSFNTWISFFQILPC